MPLIIMRGRPCTGKTSRAQELEKYFRETCQKTTHLINEENLLIDKKEGYKDNVKEKNTRSGIKAAVERFLTRDVVVICDSLNYIKGYRYELYCIARALRTTHCIVWCDVDIDQARDWNDKREGGYDPTLFEDLSQRFEEPNDKNRWDNPLFVLHAADSTPCETINDALFKTTAKPPNIATLPTVLSDTNFVYELDKMTQEIVSEILQAQNTAVLGDYIPIPRVQTKFHWTRRLTMSELRRMRQQFLKMAQLQPPKVEEIGDVFVEYLNNTTNS